jgi:GNAT superfamily N-acetyltransferase
MSENRGYEIRDMVDSDKNFIYASFLKGLYYGDSWYSEIPKPVFMHYYKQFVQSLLDSPKVTVKIACLKEDQDVILGYSILSADYLVIHWVFVKEKWRLKGIGRSLLPKYPSAVTHLSKLGRKLLIKYSTVIFNPFAI